MAGFGRKTRINERMLGKVRNYEYLCISKSGEAQSGKRLAGVISRRVSKTTKNTKNYA